MFIALIIIAGMGSAVALALLASLLTAFCLIGVQATLTGSDATDYSRVAKMTLTRAPDSSVSLTVEVMHVSADTRNPRLEEIKSQRATQFINEPVSSIEMKTGALSIWALFKSSKNEEPQWDSHLSVGGSRRELKTLLRYISEWDSTIVNVTKEYPFPSE